MKSALSITAALLLVLCSVLPTRAQESPPAAPKPAPVADRSVPRPTIPSFKATLVVLEGDWSKAATAEQIEKDLQTALKDVPVPDNLRQNLAASGPQILFASEQAYLYRPEHLNELLVWLEQHKLAKTRIDCAIPAAALGDGPAIAVDLDVLPIETGFAAPPPFVHERFQWHWSFSFMSPGSLLPDPRDTRLIVHRRLAVFREYGGQQERSEQPRGLDNTAFEFSFPLNRVAVVHVFADAHAKVWRTSRSGRGVEAILVVREASLSVPALEGHTEGSGAVRFAEEVRRVSSYLGRRSRTPSAQPPGSPSANAAQTLAQPAAEGLKIFSLRHLDAQTALGLVSQLFGRDSLAVVVEERGNALIVRGDTAKLAEVEALLLRLDSGPARGAATSSTTSSTRTEPKRAADVESQAARYRDLEKQAAETAAEYHQLRSTHADSHPQAKTLKDRLRQQVSAAFEARQQCQKAELDQLRARLAAIEQSLAARQRIKDTIIDRRVEELLEPDLQWEPRKLDAKGGKEAGHAEEPAVKAGDVLDPDPRFAPPANQGWPSRGRATTADGGGQTGAGGATAPDKAAQADVPPRQTGATADSAQLAAEQAAAEFARVQRLFEKRYVTPSEYDWAKRELDRARAAAEEVKTSVAGHGKPPTATDPGKAAQTVESAKTESLMKERRDAIRQQLETTDKRYREGNAALASVLRVADQLLEAELELATSKAERITLYEKSIADLRKKEAQAKARIEAGTMGSAGVSADEELLEAKSARLKVETRLSQEQANAPAYPALGFRDAPENAQVRAEETSGPVARSLAEAVRVFNARAAENAIGKGQSPLTEDEVIAAIRWSLLEIDKLAVSDKTIQALRGIIHSRELPPRFDLEVDTVFEPNDRMEVTMWSVRLRIPAEPQGTTCINIREQMVGSRLFGDEERKVIHKWGEKRRKDGIILLGFDREYKEERAKAAEIDRSRKASDKQPKAVAFADRAVSLPEAVRAFNARAAEDSIGKSQSPLSEDEVIAAIRWSLLDSKKLPVSGETLQWLESIPDSRELPSGFELEVMTDFQPDNRTVFTKWLVRLRIPAEPQGVTNIPIRDQMIAARTTI